MDASAMRPRRRSWRGVARPLLQQVVLALAIGASAGGAQTDEPGVRSAFVFNFLQFVDWPAGRLPETAPMVLCLLDESPVSTRLLALEGQRIRTHQVQVRKIGVSPELSGCHAVFVPSTSTWRLTGLLLHYAASGMLFISEAPGSTRVDAAINMFLHDNKVVFDVNLTAARAQDLTISSKLLRLARRVYGSAGRQPVPSEPVPLASRDRSD